MDDIPTRVAVLEQIARSTEAVLLSIQAEMRTNFAELRKAQREDFRFLVTIWISGVVALLAVMAHGFKWI